jgi:hypothetical protein
MIRPVRHDSTCARSLRNQAATRRQMIRENTDDSTARMMRDEAT